MAMTEKMVKAKLYRNKELIAGMMMMVEENMVMPDGVGPLMMKKTSEIWSDDGNIDNT